MCIRRRSKGGGLEMRDWPRHPQSMVEHEMKKRDSKRRSTRPRRGVAGPGTMMNPCEMSREPSDDAADPEQPKAAPAPGLPVSLQEYERLKRAAESGSAPEGVPAQEDRPRGTPNG